MVKLQGNLSSKLHGISESIFATMSRLANEENAINLSQGFPDFNCPKELIALVNKYMKEGHNQYAPMPGYIGLKERIVEKVENLYGAKYDADKEVIITAGATQAIYTAITAIIKEKDEVIIFEPAYDSYVPSILLSKGVPKYVTLNAPDYKINWDEVKRLISFKTKMIILNTPHNPTGSVLNDQDMKELEKLVANRDIIILSDEVYEHIIFDGMKHESISKYPSLIDKSFVISSFGKTYHTTGWKMGYVLAPENLMKEFKKVFQFLMFAAITPIQYAYADFMSNESHYLELNDFYQKKRDLFVKGLEGSRFEIIPCHGTYFQCLSYKGISEEADVDYAKTLTINSKVASVPISVFYHDKIDHKVLRFCFAKSADTIKKATEILCKI
ncbi:MAG: aminotransferase class I/II-fold pyridoxal phosphate-dependent enzyme [Bacteroidetes bacterium]|jgi:methionine transaminase|nr:aminotransferase class I/II-fold pyridoxal phosphate-dependent enzyme [Bacteroidota bacterium]MBT3799702.1 aminotransferase class I/II-fold pyridoxal phosphate-dependent enzyme [Bacteroidota bacterium]MBT4337375.1 aminotransferase class I/II-fold pyridoxal phosphate-dependent enzyme [Bacteroidota bacterium]MBT6836634.1 aminotransferase class I/II-fold pyridoxal phosphate-dependent enzyme [Bacteroidota bacterium]MBT7827333.1 aminotransferase class I/II-fold pyridoxal phosphate-dependent enzym